ncbi:hypothetical protein ACS127_14095 [Amphibacillus sp. Q70]|uniref:hypothetical protein n=1 Tax=Amphibacillus sp. Q70 TaxID=3453416 RepID=UPI003F86895F
MSKPKKLSLVSLVAIAAGQVIGAGVVTLIGPAIGVTGMSAWLAYGAAVIVGLMSVLPFIFLSSAVVLEGGEYSIVIEMLGKKSSWDLCCCLYFSNIRFIINGNFNRILF